MGRRYRDFDTETPVAIEPPGMSREERLNAVNVVVHLAGQRELQRVEQLNAIRRGAGLPGHGPHQEPAIRVAVDLHLHAEATARLHQAARPTPIDRVPVEFDRVLKHEGDRATLFMTVGSGTLRLGHVCFLPYAQRMGRPEHGLQASRIAHVARRFN